MIGNLTTAIDALYRVRFELLREGPNLQTIAQQLQLAMKRLTALYEDVERERHVQKRPAGDGPRMP